MSTELVKNDANIMPIENIQTEVEKTRVLQEVQAMVLVARQCPRNEVLATKKIMEAAKRKNLAENAMYAYPRGGQIVKGPSIRTAETIAKYWGNVSYGIKELSQDSKNNVSEVMAYAWDLETNVRQEKVFKVPHKRDKRGGGQILTDSRDIYEITANMGARRLRACLLGIIPTDIIEDFLAECEKTLAGNNNEPLKVRVMNMVQAFEGLGVTQEMIEKRLGCKADSFIEKHLVDLRAIYKSIKDNFQTIDAYFDTGKKKTKHAEVSNPFEDAQPPQEETANAD